MKPLASRRIRVQAGFFQVPDWFSTDNQCCGVAVADLAGNGTQDLVVFMIDNPPGQNRGLNRGAGNDLVVFAIDNPPGQNQAFYRILPGVTADGTSNQVWSSWLGVPNWFSWENQGGSIASRVTGGTHELAVLMVDHPPGQN